MSTVTDAAPTAPTTNGDETPTAGLSWPKLVVLLLGVAWLGAGLTWVGLQWADRPPGRSSVDVGFLQDMALHHEQALELSLLQLATGQDPTVTAFAKEILTWQSYEIGLMDAQLRDWGHDRQDRPAEAMAWMGMPVPAPAMPGMASDAELGALRAATGAEADALFLQLMTRHHAGGVHMADHAARHAADGEVRRLADLFARNQAIEIAEFAEVAERLGVELDPGAVALGRHPIGPAS